MIHPQDRGTFDKSLAGNRGTNKSSSLLDSGAKTESNKNLAIIGYEEYFDKFKYSAKYINEQTRIKTSLIGKFEIKTFTRSKWRILFKSIRSQSDVRLIISFLRILYVSEYAYSPYAESNYRGFAMSSNVIARRTSFRKLNIEDRRKFILGFFLRGEMIDPWYGRVMQGKRNILYSSGDLDLLIKFIVNNQKEAIVLSPGYFKTITIFKYVTDFVKSFKVGVDHNSVFLNVIAVLSVEINFRIQIALSHARIDEQNMQVIIGLKTGLLSYYKALEIFEVERRAELRNYLVSASKLIKVLAPMKKKVKVIYDIIENYLINKIVEISLGPEKKDQYDAFFTKINTTLENAKHKDFRSDSKMISIIRELQRRIIE